MGSRLLDWLWDLQAFNCREAARLSARGMDAPLSLRERAALALHDRLCHGCRIYGRQIRQLRRWLRRVDAAPFTTKLPAPRASRIKAAILAEGNKSPLAGLPRGEKTRRARGAGFIPSRNPIDPPSP